MEMKAVTESGDQRQQQLQIPKNLAMKLTTEPNRLDTTSRTPKETTNNDNCRTIV